MKSKLAVKHTRYRHSGRAKQSHSYLDIHINTKIFVFKDKVTKNSTKRQGPIDILFLSLTNILRFIMYGLFFCHVSAIYEETFGFTFWDITKIFFNGFCMDEISAYKTK